MLMLLLDDRPPSRDTEHGQEAGQTGAVWRAWSARLVPSLARLLGDAYLRGSSWGTDVLGTDPDYFTEALETARQRQAPRA